MPTEVGGIDQHLQSLKRPFRLIRNTESLDIGASVALNAHNSQLMHGFSSLTTPETTGRPSRSNGKRNATRHSESSMMRLLSTGLSTLARAVRLVRRK